MNKSRQLTIACIAADLVDGKLGGAEIHAVEVIRRLSKKHKIVLFVGPDGGIKRNFGRRVKVYTVAYPKIPNLYGIAYIIWGYFQITRELNDLNFDLLWAKQSYPQAVVAAILKVKYKKPVYVTAQNPMLHKEEMTIKGEWMKKLGGGLVNLLTPVIGWGLGQADTVAAVSKYSAKLARKMGAKRVVVIPNGVDLKQFPMTNDKLQMKKKKLFTILTTSALIFRNGIDTLIDAVSLLPSDLNWHLVIAGEGPEKKSLEFRVGSLELGDRVNFLGRVNNSKIPHLLRKADVFVRPSRREGFGVSFIEAMASGVPVIGTAVGGLTDFLVHEKTGLVVATDDAKGLAKAIEMIYQEKILVKKMVIRSREMVRLKYNWDKIAASVEKEMVRLC